MITAQLFVPVAVAITLYGQPLPQTRAGVGVWTAALLLTSAGIVSLSRAPGVERTFAA